MATIIVTPPPIEQVVDGSVTINISKTPTQLKIGQVTEVEVKEFGSFKTITSSIDVNNTVSSGFKIFKDARDLVLLSAIKLSISAKKNLHNVIVRYHKVKFDLADRVIKYGVDLNKRG